MVDPYSILGLSKHATNAEIKAAYRRLVKIYHPDKNPNNPSAIEKFRLIQTAYDILSDPVKKAKYDDRFAYTGFSQSTTQQANTKSRTKKYTFTEEDLKKRQYYKTHYQHHNKKSTAKAQEEKKAYNEVRYILFSVPVAVALLFFIINIYTHQRHKTGKDLVYTENKPATDTFSIVSNEHILKTSDQPYNSWFGGPILDRTTLQVVEVTNWSGLDAVVCIVDADKNRVIRNYYIANNYNILYEYLPEGKYYIKAYIGLKFNPTLRQPGSLVSGAFESKEQFQSFPDNPFIISPVFHDTISRDILFIKDRKSKNIINSEQFFGK